MSSVKSPLPSQEKLNYRQIIGEIVSYNCHLPACNRMLQKDKTIITKLCFEFMSSSILVVCVVVVNRREAQQTFCYCIWTSSNMCCCYVVFVQLWHTKWLNINLYALIYIWVHDMSSFVYILKLVYNKPIKHVLFGYKTKLLCSICCFSYCSFAYHSACWFSSAHSSTVLHNYEINHYTLPYTALTSINSVSPFYK